jgi:hypothetical protein
LRGADVDLKRKNENTGEEVFRGLIKWRRMMGEIR